MSLLFLVFCYAMRYFAPLLISSCADILETCDWLTFFSCPAVRGMMYYKRALMLQARLEGASESGSFFAFVVRLQDFLSLYWIAMLPSDFISCQFFCYRA